VKNCITYHVRLYERKCSLIPDVRWPDRTSSDLMYNANHLSSPYVRTTYRRAYDVWCHS
jgi:hypothetical protein